MATIPIKKNDSCVLRVACKDDQGVAIPIDRVLLTVKMSTPYVLDLPASDGVNGIALIPVPPGKLNEVGKWEATVQVFNDVTLQKTAEFKFNIDDHVGV